jgi:hypothetical protein
VSEAHLELGLHFHAKDPRGQGGGGLTNAEQVCWQMFCRLSLCISEINHSFSVCGGSKVPLLLAALVHSFTAVCPNSCFLPLRRSHNRCSFRF